MKISWLHLSDLQFKDGGRHDENRMQAALVAAVEGFRKKGMGLDLVFATGDIAHCGKSDEYGQATEFFGKLLEAAGLERDRLFLVPGNHDVFCPAGIGLARTLDADEADVYFSPDICAMPHLTVKQKNFIEWYDDFFKGLRKHPDKSSCGPVQTVEIKKDDENFRLDVLPLNTVLFSMNDGKDYSTLMVGRRCLDEALGALSESGSDLKFALMHHPLEWLNPAEEERISARLTKWADVILSGHFHKAALEGAVSSYGRALFMSAGAACETGQSPSFANYVELENGAARFHSINCTDTQAPLWKLDSAPFICDGSEHYNQGFPLPRVKKTDDIKQFDLGNGIVLDMIWIEGGSFNMGSDNNDADEKPVHKIRVNDFWLGLCQVTQAQYKAIIGDNPSLNRGDDLPVERVSWHDAIKFCNCLAEKTGHAFRLPAEAEWEYACRAGSPTEFFFGDAEAGLDDHAWFSRNSDKKTHPVRQKKPNQWGLYDMYGNVWEWCGDWYDRNYYADSPRSDPKGPDLEGFRVARGGSWHNQAKSCRSARRNGYWPVDRYHDLGMRLACSFSGKSGE